MSKAKLLWAATAGAALLTAAAGAASAQTASSLVGRWDAVLVDNGPDVPFRLDIAADGSGLKGTFYDGAQPYETTTSGAFKDGKLVLTAEHYLTTISAKLENGKLVGETTLQGPGYGLRYGFEAVRHVDAPAAQTDVPQIAGSWVIPLDAPSSKGEKAFRFVVKQNGAEAEASILRIDGDTGAYSGSFKNGKWVLSHFDGHRPGVIEVSAKSDGTLEVIEHNEALTHALAGNDSKEYSAEQNTGASTPRRIAYRPQVAEAKGFAKPDDFLAHTKVRDPNEKFAFNFPDASGKLVSSEDPRFKGKVVVAVVTGTWCPNCHDEAQYLVQLDKQYRDKGLAIVALDFEEPEQLASLQRAKAFIKQYGVNYTYLYPGTPAQMWEKVPQLNHLDTWPATVFIGRDGKVDAVHSGFASAASGEFHAELKADFTSRIERLLTAKAPDQQVALAEAAR